MPVTVEVLFVPAGVKETVPLVPVGVTVCVCPASGLPEKLGVEFVGTPAGQEIVGVDAASVPAPCECAEPAPLVTAEPVKTSAGTVRFGAVALAAVSEPVPAAIFVAAVFPDVVVAAFVPAAVTLCV